MADLIIGYANVVESASASLISGYASGTTIVAGNLVYRHTDGTYKLASATAAATAAVVGMAANSAAAGQPIEIFTAGDITIATGTQGERYYASKNGGGLIMPSGDLATTNYVTLIGVALSSSVIRLNIFVSGVQVP